MPGAGDSSSENIFAGELVIEPTAAQAPRKIARRIGASLTSGAIAGVLPTATAFTLYYARWRELALPWFEIGTIAVFYGLGCGAFMAMLIELAVMAFTRIGRIAAPLRIAFNPIVAATIMASLASILPGAIGVGVFAGYHGPPVSTPLLVAGCAALSMLLAVPLARRERAARGKPPRKRLRALIVVGGAIPPLSLAALIAPPLVATLSRSTPTLGGYMVGAEAGLIAGAIEGLYIGVVTLWYS